MEKQPPSKTTKGLILAAGKATRLFPSTLVTSKQLLPVYDKPMVYYPLSTLINAGINQIAFVTAPHDQDRFQQLLGDGQQLGCQFSYLNQKKPLGIADVFKVGRDYIGRDNVALVLGDNIFHGSGFNETVREAVDPEGGVVFGSRVNDPERYGVVEFDETGRVISIEEKPEKPKSDYAVPGLYFYDNQVVDIAHALEPSDRGELEITDVNLRYLEMGQLVVKLLDRVVWLDTGTIDSMHDATEYVRVIEKRVNQKVGCIEEAAWREGWIDDAQLERLAEPLTKSGYGQYLLSLIK